MGFVEDLVAALRSGEYKQTTGLLRAKNDGGEECFCVEGVAADVALKKGYVTGWEWQLGDSGYSWTLVKDDLEEYYGEKRHSAYSPDEVALLTVPRLDHCIDGPRNVMHMNDSYSLSFVELADVIESKFVNRDSESDE